MKLPKEKNGSAGVKDIARLAGVSIGTVDRVLNNRTGVSEKTKANILKIIKDLNYQPNIFARRLASKKLKFATLIPLSSEETNYWKTPLEGIQQAAAEIKDFGIEVTNFFFDQNQKSTFVKSAKKILAGDFDGIVMAPMFEEESIWLIRECEKKKTPLVLINSDIPDQNHLSYIGPELYQSGYLSAHLINYMAPQEKKILIVNISKEIDLHHHLLRKEEGFRNYFESNQLPAQIDKIDIRQTDYPYIKKKLADRFKKNQYDIVFVTNSRVSAVARYFEEQRISHIKLIGYDYLEENLAFLKKGTIDFLICQKSKQQGYRSIMTIYHHLMKVDGTVKQQYMPIDILTRENYIYYEN